MAIRAWIEKGYWWWMLRTSTTIRMHGLSFVYISSKDDCPAHEIQRALADALDRISKAKGGFGELVTSHLRFVAALDAPQSAVVYYARGYVSPFPSIECRNPHFLACRLIWAATYVRLSQDALGHERPRDLEAIRQASYEAQVRFTKQFADAQEWIEYLEKHPSGI